MTLQEKVLEYFDELVKQEGAVTVEEVMKFLNQKGIKMTWLGVSKILVQSKCKHDNGVIRRYYSLPDKKLSVKDGIDMFLQVWDTSKPVTKKFVKTFLTENKIVFTPEDFDYHFNKGNFEPNGEYNKENHKYYRVRRNGEHFSITEQETVEIHKMHPNYIYNIIQKKYPNTLLIDCFNRSSEVFQLLKAYFLYDIRKFFKDII